MEQSWRYYKYQILSPLKKDSGLIWNTQYDYSTEVWFNAEEVAKCGAKLLPVVQLGCS